MATTRLPTIRSVQGVASEAQPEPQPQPELQPQPQPQPEGAVELRRPAGQTMNRSFDGPLSEESMSITSSEQVQLVLDEGSVRSQAGPNAQRSLRGARRNSYTQRKGHRPDDMLAFWCLEEFSYLRHEEQREGDAGPGPHRELRHKLYRRDLLKLLNDNRSELLQHIKPVVGPATKTGTAAVKRSAAARAAAGANGATPRPQTSTAARATQKADWFSSKAAASGRVELDVPSGQPAPIYKLRTSGSEDGLSSLARGSGSDSGIGLDNTVGNVGSGTQQADGARGQVAVRHGGGGRAQIRDLRLLDVASCHRSNGIGKPAIWVRHSCILVSLEGFRCAIMRQRLLLFSVPTHCSIDAHTVGRTSSHATKGGTGRARSSYGRDGDESDSASERAVVESIRERLHESARTPRNSSSSGGSNHLVSDNESLTWELRAFELFLEEAVWRLEDDFTVLENNVKGAIALIQSTARGGLGAMHRAKRALLLYVTRAQDVHNVLENLLSDPEDLAAMHLTDRRLFEGNRRTMSQTDSFQSWKAGGGGGASIEDLEMMIETYADTALNLLQAGQQLEEEVKDTEELVSLQLDTQRNQILGVEMIITIVSTGFALGAFVVGIFGMNFQWQGSFMEKRTDEDMRGGNLFIVTVAATCGTLVLGAVVVIALIRARFPKLLSLE